MKPAAGFQSRWFPDYLRTQLSLLPSPFKKAVGKGLASVGNTQRLQQVKGGAQGPAGLYVVHFLCELSGGRKTKVFTFSFKFNSSKHNTGREFLQRSSTWPNQGKIGSSQSLEASPLPISASFPPAVAYCPTPVKLIPESYGPDKWSHPGLPDRTFCTLSLILKLSIIGVGNRFRGRKEHTKLLNSYSVNNCIFFSTNYQLNKVLKAF